MAQKRDLLFRFLGDSKDLQQASGKARGALGGVDKASGKANKGMSLLGKGAVALGGAFAASKIVSFMGNAVNRAEEMGSANAITAQLIEQTGGAANLTSGQIKDMNAQLALQTGIDKALIAQGSNVLLTFKNIADQAGEGNDIFARTQALMLDVATVMGTDAKSAAVQLGKALNDPAVGMSMLSRSGITFSKAQQQIVKDMVASGDLLGAQKFLLAEIESQFGGTAEASADATDKIKNGWLEIQEAIGNAVLPAIESFAEKVPGILASAEGAVTAFRLGLETLNIAVGSGDDELRDWLSILGSINDRLAEGIKPTQVAAEAMAHMAKTGTLSAKNLERLREETGLTKAEMGEAAEFAMSAGAGFDMWGIHTQNLTDYTADYRRELAGRAIPAQEEYTEGAMDLAFATNQAADADREHIVAIQAKNSAILETINPYFKAKEATRRYEEALEAASEDEKITAEEAENLVRKSLEMESALAGVSTENFQGAVEAVAKELGITNEEAAELLRKGGEIDAMDAEGDIRIKVDRTDLDDLEAVRRNLENLVIDPMRVTVEAKIDSYSLRKDVERILRDMNLPI